MSENYEVYKRRERRTHTTRPSAMGSYTKKFSRQALICIICLSVVFLIEMSNSSMGNSINNGIKSALNYQPNASGIRLGITSVLDKLIEKK